MEQDKPVSFPRRKRGKIDRLVFGFLALAHDQLLFQSPFLLVVGLAMLSCVVVLCKVYFFSWPLRGVSIALACYVASIALSRA